MWERFRLLGYLVKTKLHETERITDERSCDVYTCVWVCEEQRGIVCFSNVGRPVESACPRILERGILLVEATWSDARRARPRGRSNSIITRGLLVRRQLVLSDAPVTFVPVTKTSDTSSFALPLSRRYYAFFLIPKTCLTFQRKNKAFICATRTKATSSFSIENTQRRCSNSWKTKGRQTDNLIQWINEGLLSARLITTTILFSGLFPRERWVHFFFYNPHSLWLYRKPYSPGFCLSFKVHLH